MIVYFQAQQLNRILDQQEQGMGGGTGGGRGSYDNNNLLDGKRGGGYDMGGMQMVRTYT